MLKIDYKDLPTSENPITDYCRKLIEDGENPDQELEAYKNGVLNMKVKNIGIATTLIADGARWRLYRG